jgi:intraflagellar transport protein 80
MSVEGEDLNTAEVAYAAIDQVHKVEYINYIKAIPTPAGRNAEMALFRNQPQEAENILLGNGLVFRAINLWICLFNWDRYKGSLVLSIRH